MEKGGELLLRTEALRFGFIYLGLGRMDGFSSRARPLQHQLLWGSCAKEVVLRKGSCAKEGSCWSSEGFGSFFHTAAGYIRATGPLLTFAGCRARRPSVHRPSTVKPLCALWHSTSIACATPPPSTTPANSHPQPPLTSQGTETQQCGPPSGGWTRKGPGRPRR